MHKVLSSCCPLNILFWMRLFAAIDKTFIGKYYIYVGEKSDNNNAVFYKMSKHYNLQTMFYPLTI